MSVREGGRWGRFVKGIGKRRERRGLGVERVVSSGGRFIGMTCKRKWIGERRSNVGGDELIEED